MAVSNYLFELIKSLSPSEKRYFKLFSSLQKSRAEEKNYLRLFDFIAAQDAYDEEAILEAFAGENFIKSLHVTKNYLYNLILKSLRIFEEERKNAHRQLSNLLMNASVLENRGLYDQSRDMLNRALKIAQKYDKHFFIIEILHKKISIISGFQLKKIDENALDTFQLLDEAFDRQSKETAYLKLYYRVSLMMRTRDRENKQLKTEVEEIAALPLLKIPPKKNSAFFTKVLFHLIHAAVFYFEEDMVQYNNAMYASLKVWDDHKQQKKESPHYYILQVANYLNSCHSVSDYSNFSERLQEIKSLRCTNFNEAAEAFQNVAFLELLYYLNTDNLDKAEQAIDGIIQGLERYKKKINKARETSFYYNISILFFLVGKYEKALHWADKILNDEKNGHRKDLQRFAHILELIYHYELRNFRYAESRCQANYRKLKKWGSLNALEIMILKQFNSILYPTSKAELIERFRFINQKVEELESEHDSNTFLGIEELKIWLKSKLPPNDPHK